MTKQTLLKTLRGLGYADDKPTLDSVKAFVESEAIELQDENGNSIDVSKSWNEKTVITAEAPVETGRKMTKTEAKGAGARTASVTEGTTESKPQAFAIGNLQKSLYQQKIKSGKAAVPDADLAEVIGSCFRVNAMKSRGIESWENRTRDLEVTKGLNTYTNENGGYLVPPAELMRELIYNGEPTGVARSVANVVRMNGAQTSYARESADVTLPVLAEGGTLQPITPAFDRVQPQVRKTGGYFESTMEEMEDSAFNVGDIITRKTQIAYDNRIDDDYFLGDGTSTYNQFTGLANSTNVTNVAAAGAAWTNITLANIFSCLGTLQAAGSDIMGICSRQFAFNVLANLNYATSQFKQVFRMNPDQRGGVFAESLPIMFSQRMPIASAGTSRCLYIGNFKAGSMVGERRDLTIKPDDRTGLTTDSFRWYVTARYSVLIHGHGRTELTNQNIVALRTT